MRMYFSDDTIRANLYTLSLKQQNFQIDVKIYLGEHGPRKKSLVLKTTCKVPPEYVVAEVHLTFRMSVNETRVEAE